MYFVTPLIGLVEATAVPFVTSRLTFGVLAVSVTPLSFCNVLVPIFSSVLTALIGLLDRGRLLLSLFCESIIMIFY